MQSLEVFCRRSPLLLARTLHALRLSELQLPQGTAVDSAGHHRDAPPVYQHCDIAKKLHSRAGIELGYNRFFKLQLQRYHSELANLDIATHDTWGFLPPKRGVSLP